MIRLDIGASFGDSAETRRPVQKLRRSGAGGYNGESLLHDGVTMLLTKHEGVTFQNQTVYISGQAFVRCTFIACTLVLRETIYHLEDCTFERCNWHVDWVLLWGSPESIAQIKALVDRIEQAQKQLDEQTRQQQQTAPGPGPSPFA